MNRPRSWRLDSPAQTLIFASRDGTETPECLYWGAPLPVGEDLDALAQMQRRAAPRSLLDRYAPLSICPEERRGWLGRPGFTGTDLEGRTLLPRFSISDAEQSSEALTFRLECAETGLKLVQTLEVFADTDMVMASACLEAGEPGLRLNWLGACAFPVADRVDRIVDFTGRWLGEFQAQETPWNVGVHVRESREGRTGHAHFPGMMLPAKGAGNTSGDVYALHLGWSGGHRGFAEELPDGRRQVQMGAFLRPGEVILSADGSYATPPLFATFSTEGANGVMAAFHRHARKHVVRFPTPDRPRPVHYNCWEAIYFDHDIKTLKDIATKAAALGAERFVLDDGWFRGRTDDTAGLGDWVLDRGKYPEGLGPLIDHIEDLGMSFGLWVEPEMINADSELYRAHPDWVLGGMAEGQLSGRHQYLLDLTRPEVSAHLFSRIDALLREYRIDYLKWDHNRPLIAGTARQTQAFYALVDRLRKTHASLEIESCASGGGRIDFGVLSHTHRIWLSDSNDALERLRMQSEAALFLPPEIIGSHVGPRVCHTSGRVLPMAFRAWTAATRHMGFEMDPRELTEEEAGTLARITAWWKANRDWTFAGRLHRLDSLDDAVIAEMTVSVGKERFVLFVGQTAASARSSTRPVRLTGLNPDARYRLRLINQEDIRPNLSRDFKPPYLSDGGPVLSGAALIGAGIHLPPALPAIMWVVEGEMLNS